MPLIPTTFPVTSATPLERDDATVKESKTNRRFDNDDSPYRVKRGVGDDGDRGRRSRAVVAARRVLVTPCNGLQLHPGGYGMAGRRGLGRVDDASQVVVSRRARLCGRRNRRLPGDHLRLLLVASLASRIVIPMAMVPSTASQPAAHRGRYQLLQTPVRAAGQQRAFERDPVPAGRAWPTGRRANGADYGP